MVKALEKLSNRRGGEKSTSFLLVRTNSNCNLLNVLINSNFSDIFHC